MRRQRDLELVLCSEEELAENRKGEGDLGGRTVNNYSKKKQGIRKKSKDKGLPKKNTQKNPHHSRLQPNQETYLQGLLGR